MTSRALAASAGATTRRLEPDALLSLAAELTAPDIGGYRDGGTERPPRRWAPRDPLHEQCTAPGRALTVAPTGLTFHHPDGEDGASGGDIAVRVLSAVAFPEVWPGWRGNALIGDFHRDFLQPGCPVLTCLTVTTGDEAAGEKAFLKSARATQQAGTGIAKYLPGLPEKARDWQAVTDRIKDGEKLVRACYMAAVYAPLDALDEAEQAVRAIYHGQGWRVNAERYMQLPSWLACLPMASAGGLDSDLERMGRMKTLLTSSAVNLAPWHGEWRGQPANPENPPALFLIGRRGQPACWSPFANEAGNYNVDVVAFHRPYKRLGVEKGDELRVARVDHRTRTVNLERTDGWSVAWEPNRIAARAGGVEVYRSEEIELRAGDRIRWTRNDAGLGLVNSGTAEVAAVRDGKVTFRLEDGRTLDLAPGDPQLRHVDRAWASTVHAFQGRTVDTVIAAMEANHPHLTTQKSFYVEISRARDRAELVTDDREALKEQLEAATGERIAALEAVEPGRAKGQERGLDVDRSANREDRPSASRDLERMPEPDRSERDLAL